LQIAVENGGALEEAALADFGAGVGRVHEHVVKVHVAWHHDGVGAEEVTGRALGGLPHLGSEVGGGAVGHDAVLKGEVADAAAKERIVAPVAAGDVGVVEGGAGAGHVGLAHFVHQPQLVAVAAVHHVEAIHAGIGGEVELLHGVAVEGGALHDVAARVHEGHERVLGAVLAAFPAVVEHDLDEGGSVTRKRCSGRSE